MRRDGGQRLAATGNDGQRLRGARLPSELVHNSGLFNSEVSAPMSKLVSTRARQFRAALPSGRQGGRVERRELTIPARVLATSAHAGQVDKAGRPYIEHPARVAALVAVELGAQHPAVAVAWLHDVVEDTDVSLVEIRQAFGQQIAAGVDAMTRRGAEEPEAYYARVRADELALAVKRADIADNTDPARVALLDQATAARLAGKYRHARAELGLAS